ncbi:small ribosomal subunit biogenesis GTPase RsgA 1, mitochondrial [Argentina anserina]|uniref:small ribosomal subunit biogenesis GTPase RsgA 1, mitochondrial n=1 Tax=Argentina anserina TaxID=57926 RepID=UPI0021761FD1|nr:small ribosomal subunit biogenesis GTPase RsgA 1, mitochondrial [Potentilla anserina]
MPIASISILRHHSLTVTVTPPAFNNLLRRFAAVRCVPIAAAKQHQNPNLTRKSQPPDKKLLRAKQTFKDYSSLAPILSPQDKPPLSESQTVGTVAAAQANFMRVIVEAPGSLEKSADGTASQVELLCVVRALLKKIKRRVLVGDKVLVGSIDWVDRRGMIENVYRRSSEILDPPVANVDHLLVLFSLEQPKLDPFALTRFLIEAESTEIPLTLALNKCELVDQETMATWKARLHKWGYKPLFCSVESESGLDSLASILRDQTSVIVGPSGVGKSSLINALRNSDHHAFDAADADNRLDPIVGSKWLEDQRVGQVSVRSGKGKHTTRHVSLLPLSGGGYLADTPGFSQPSLMKVTKQSLAEAFPEIQKILNDTEGTKCAFSDCLHLGEKGCVVGTDWERYPYYFQLLDEIRIREEFQLRTFGTKKEGDVRIKAGQAEPRLERKKHRRVSRKRINQSLLDELDELDDDNLLDEVNQ